MIIFIGCQNAGKSTLFNRFLGKHQAVVSPVAGTTIDCARALVEWDNISISIVDVAGLPVPKNNPLREKIMNQVENTLQEANAIVFIIDSHTGITNKTQQLLHDIIKYKIPKILVINKIDNKNNENNCVSDKSMQRFSLRFNKTFYLSALHGRGVSSLLDYLKQWPAKKYFQKIPSIVIAGRQNVGKSTLFNRLLLKNRAIVSDIAGTTRDSVQDFFTVQSKTMSLIDTAGVRKRGRVDSSIEKQSVGNTFSSIEKADILVLVIDALVGPARQDVHIAKYFIENKKPLLFVVNKWDLIQESNSADKSIDNVQKVLYTRFPFLRQHLTIPISALTGKNCDYIIRWVQQSLDTLEHERSSFV